MYSSSFESVFDASAMAPQSPSDMKPARQDDQVASAEAVEQVVGVLEAGGHAGHVVLLLGELRDLLERLGEQGVHLGERGRHALLGHAEERLLGVLHHLVQVVGRVVGERVDGGGGVDELAEDGRALHDLGVVLPVRERKRVVGQIDQVRLAAHGLQLARGNAARIQLADGLEDDAARRAVERLRLELQDKLLHRLGVQHAGRQNRLLGLDVLRHRLVLGSRPLVEVAVPCAGLVRFRHGGPSRSFGCPLPCFPL